MMEFEVRHWMSNHEGGIGEAKQKSGKIDPNTIGQFILRIERPTWRSTGTRRTRPGSARIRSRGRSVARVATISRISTDAVRSRKRADLTAEIAEGAISTTLIHLANISYRLGRTVNFDAASYSCLGDKEARTCLRGPYPAGLRSPKLA